MFGVASLKEVKGVSAVSFIIVAVWGREARTSFEGGILSPTGVLAAHKIMASSPDMDQATVSALRVGARRKQIESLNLFSVRV